MEVRNPIAHFYTMLRYINKGKSTSATKPTKVGRRKVQRTAEDLVKMVCNSFLAAMAKIVMAD
jgi:hypothetical protein